MTEQEYLDLLTQAVDRRVITTDQAAQLYARFIAGDFDETELPLSAAEAKKDDDDILGFLVAWSLANGIGAQRASLRERKQWREANRAGFEMGIGALTSKRKNVREWQGDFSDVLVSAMAGQYIAGYGRESIDDMILLSELIDTQMAFMYRFGGDVHFRQATGQPYSDEQLNARSLMYGGAAWAAWFAGNEAWSYGSGYIVRYVARDDRRTCSPCRGAVGYYRLGSGPYPGQICYGGYRCRCERIVMFAPEIAATL